MHNITRFRYVSVQIHCMQSAIDHPGKGDSKQGKIGIFTLSDLAIIIAVLLHSKHRKTIHQAKSKSREARIRRIGTDIKKGAYSSDSEDIPPVCVRTVRIITPLSENPVNPLILILIALHQAHHGKAPGDAAAQIAEPRQGPFPVNDEAPPLCRIHQ